MLSCALVLACAICSDRIDSHLADCAMIERALTQLASPKFRDRESASREIFVLGERAIQPLRDHIRTTEDVEVERRLEAILAKLERQRLIEPRRITFTGTRTISELLTIISTQTGYRLNIQQNQRSEQKQKLTVKWDRTPFWQAIDEACDAAGLLVEPYGNNDSVGMAISIFDNDASNPHVSRSGPFRAVATNISLNRNVQLANVPRRNQALQRSEAMVLNLQVFSEPKTPMIRTPTVRVIKAIDDRGTDLVLTEDAEHRSYYRGSEQSMRTNNAHLWVNFGRPHRDATIIKELTANVSYTLLQRTRPLLVIESIAKSLNKPFSCRSAEVKVLTLNDMNAGQFSIRIVHREKASQQEAYDWGAGIQQRYEILDEQNRPFQLVNVVSIETGSEGTTLDLAFAAPDGESRGKPTKLTFVEWVGTTVESHITFRNLPLP
jgi:hypothetical protein